MNTHLLIYRIGNHPATYGELMRFQEDIDISEIIMQVRRRIQELANEYFTDVQTVGLYNVTTLGVMPEELQMKYGAVAYDDLDVKQLLPLFMTMGISTGVNSFIARPLAIRG